MYFKNRIEAADLLVGQLLRYRNQNPLVLGVPRGGVPMAKRIADGLEGDLDVVLVHKIGAPENPEFAIGSVSEFETVYRNEAAIPYGFHWENIESLAQKEIEKLRQRRQAYSPVRPPLSPAGRTVILVDDGVATGATMLAAVRAIKSQQPQRIIVAAPVISPSAKRMLSEEADEVVALSTPVHFYAISQFYEDFPQVTDQEVLADLSEGRQGRQSASSTVRRKKSA